MPGFECLADARHPRPPSGAPPVETLEVGAEIGSGAIATVFRVHDAVSGSAFAAKVLHPRHERDEGARARFRREAELASALDHPNIVRVHGVREVEGRTALLMELVEGPTLATAIAKAGHLDPDRFVGVARGIAAGLAYAHGRGVIHRDLKPANVLLTEGAAPVAKIADFGMARAASFANADRRAMTVLGTPQYMAPECLDPLAVDARTDLYALGCILHEMATGSPPYGGATPYAVLEAHRSAPIPSLPDSFDPRLAALTARLLAKAPGERPQSAEAVVALLDAYVSEDAALVPVVDPDDAANGSCARCGADVHPELRLCFRCGTVQAFLEPGAYSVFVLGPGRLSHKFSTELRDRLVRWLRANRSVGLDPQELERRIPRLAFPLAAGVSQLSADTLVDAMQHLGLWAEARRGGTSAHESVRAVASALTRRGLTLAGAIWAVPMLLNPFFGAALTLPGMLLTAPIVFLLARRSANRIVVELSHDRTRQRSLPPAVQGQLNQLYGRISAIKEARHRDALRAVVHRVIDLTRTLPEDARAEVDSEMGHAIKVAATASFRMDALDAEMAQANFDPAEPEHRALMHERDLWSGRLLSLTATLDAFATRHASAKQRLEDAEENDLVAALRDTVEALEEVQRA